MVDDYHSNKSPSVINDFTTHPIHTPFLSTDADHFYDEVDLDIGLHLKETPNKHHVLHGRRRLSTDRYLKEELPSLKQTLKQIMTISLPISASYTCYMLISTINVIFAGQLLDENKLSGVGLGSLIVNCLGLSIGFGVNSAVETFVTQSIGRKTPLIGAKFLGVAQFLSTIISILVTIALQYTFEILVYLNQNKLVAGFARDYAVSASFAMFPSFQGDLLSRYLTCYGKPQIVFVVASCFVLIHFIIAYYFVFILDMGVAGIGWALTCSEWALLVMVISVFFCFGNRLLPPGALSFIPCTREEVNNHNSSLSRELLLSSNTSNQVSSNPSQLFLKRLKLYINLSIPSLIMATLEWWAFEFATLVIGITHNSTELAAHITIVNIAGLAYMIPIGIQVAMSTIVGRAVGSRLSKNILKFLMKTGLFYAFCFDSLCLLVLWLFRSVLANFYAPGQDNVQQVYYSLFTLLIIFSIGDCQQCVSQGLFKAFGLQKYGAIGQLMGGYFIALPLGCWFCLSWGLGARGMWLGTCLGAYMTCTAYLFISRFLISVDKQVALCAVKMDNAHS